MYERVTTMYFLKAASSFLSLEEYKLTRGVICIYVYVYIDVDVVNVISFIWHIIFLRHNVRQVVA